MTQEQKWLAYVAELRNKHDKELSDILNKLPSDEDLAIEVAARFTGNSRGTPIAKKAFVDGVLWCINKIKNA